MERASWTEIVTNENVPRKVNEDKHVLHVIVYDNGNGLITFRDTMAYCMISLKKE